MDEVEFMENLFDALCSALGETANKKIFLEEEGGQDLLFFGICLRGTVRCLLTCSCFSSDS